MFFSETTSGPSLAARSVSLCGENPALPPPPPLPRPLGEKLLLKMLFFSFFFFCMTTALFPRLSETQQSVRAADKWSAVLTHITRSQDNSIFTVSLKTQLMPTEVSECHLKYLYCLVYFFPLVKTTLASSLPQVELPLTGLQTPVSWQ